MSNKIGKDTGDQVVINSLKDCKNCDNIVDFLNAKYGKTEGNDELRKNLALEAQALQSEMDQEAFEQWLKEHQAMLEEFEERYPLPASKAIEKQAQPSAQRQQQPLKAEDMPGPTYTAGGMGLLDDCDDILACLKNSAQDENVPEPAKLAANILLNDWENLISHDEKAKTEAIEFFQAEKPNVLVAWVNLYTSMTGRNFDVNKLIAGAALRIS